MIPVIGQSMSWVFIIPTCSIFNIFATKTSHNQQVNCMLKCFTTNWLHENRISIWSKSQHMKHILQALNWIENLVVQKNHSIGQHYEKTHKQVLYSFLSVDFKEKIPHFYLLFKIKTLFLLDQVGFLIFIFTTSALLEFQLSSLLKLRHPCRVCNNEVKNK